MHFLVFQKHVVHIAVDKFQENCNYGYENREFDSTATFSDDVWITATVNA